MYKNILVAVDNDPRMGNVLDNAIRTALAYNSKLTICHIKKNTTIYNPIDPTGMLATTHVFVQDHSYSLDEELDKAKEQAHAAGIKEVEIVQTYSSSPGIAIAEVIAPSYAVDLIVCGRSHKSSFNRFLLGSVSSNIVNYAHCDVKLIRSPKA